MTELSLITTAACTRPMPSRDGLHSCPQGPATRQRLRHQRYTTTQGNIRLNLLHRRPSEWRDPAELDASASRSLRPAGHGGPSLVESHEGRKA
ncbi:hypothetical protein E2C01_054702 [Portunus trituberculatus]|uniref:Uncharacterized protein n=1 Tax=Portunus trituberculatus TaxID=210409 RepID=A0A5B7GTZ8_PORTR|nr:hypothetical protein [Portunus trituberculatus]